MRRSPVAGRELHLGGVVGVVDGHHDVPAAGQVLRHDGAEGSVIAGARRVQQDRPRRRVVQHWRTGVRVAERRGPVHRARRGAVEELGRGVAEMRGRRWQHLRGHRVTRGVPGRVEQADHQLPVRRGCGPGVRPGPVDQVQRHRAHLVPAVRYWQPQPGGSLGRPDGLGAGWLGAIGHHDDRHCQQYEPGGGEQPAGAPSVAPGRPLAVTRGAPDVAAIAAAEPETAATARRWLVRGGVHHNS
jgi:hypothetical protein